MIDLRTDFVLLGYPKTGNTWVHYIIRTMVGCSWFDIFQTHGVPNFNSLNYHDMRISRLGGRRHLIVLVRHAGDVIVSFYMHLVHREKDCSYFGSIDEIVYDNIFGIDKYLEYYRQVHDIVIPSFRSVMLVRYEDLLAATSFWVEEIADFIKFDVTVGRRSGMIMSVDDIVRHVSFRSMNEMERIGSNDDVPTLRRSVHWRETSDSFKVREGKSGEYVRHLKPETVLHIQKRMRELPDYYGYG